MDFKSNICMTLTNIFDDGWQNMSLFVALHLLIYIWWWRLHFQYFPTALIICPIHSCFAIKIQLGRLVSLPLVPDNKFRILKNGGVHAALKAMTSFRDDEAINLNALKLLCNLQESGGGAIATTRAFPSPDNFFLAEPDCVLIGRGGMMN